MKLVDWLRLITLSILWGASFIFIEIALESAGPRTIVLGRVVLAALALLAWCRAARIHVPLTPAILTAFVVMGILNNVIPFNLIAWGQTRTTGGVASILNATTPLFTVVVAHLWPGGERASPSRIAGVVIGLLGVAVLIGLGNLAALSGEVAGQVAILGAAFCYALSALYGRRLTGIPPLAAAAGMLTASSIMLTPVTLMTENPFDPLPGWPALAAIAGIAILSSALAYGIFFRLIATIGSNVMLVTFLIPVTAVAAGVVLLGEPVEARHLGGLALIFCGLALVDGRLARLFRGGS